MIAEQQMSHTFMALFGQATPALPGYPSLETQRLRVALLQEEVRELEDAFAAGDLVAIADALGDILYVTYGAGNACGLDLQPIFAEIHRSNMTKIWRTVPTTTPPGVTIAPISPLEPGASGGWIVRRDDGKILKPPTYSPPDLRALLLQQMGVSDG